VSQLCEARHDSQDKVRAEAIGKMGDQYPSAESERNQFESNHFTPPIELEA